MTQRQRLTVLLVLNVAMIAALIIVGLLSRSLGVLAAGGDYVADSVAILLGIVAVALRDRGRGKSRAPTYVALVNGLALLVVSTLVLVGAVHRLLNGTPGIHGLPVLIVSAAATLVMLIGALILGRDAGSEDLHMRSVMLDTLSDAAASGAVAIGGGVIAVAHGLYWLDSALAGAISVVVGLGALRLLRDVARALRNRTVIEVDHD